MASGPFGFAELGTGKAGGVESDFSVANCKPQQDHGTLRHL